MKILLALLLAMSAVSATAADNNRIAEIVLFHAADAKSPADHEDRLRSLGRYVEAFLNREMKRWNRPIKRTQIFARAKDGKIRVTVITGELASSGRDALAEIRTRALRSAGQQLHSPPDKAVTADRAPNPYTRAELR
jgi:hypothetical protein